MKKAIALMLSLWMALAVFMLPVGALYLNAGEAALSGLFQDGKTTQGADYVYYSPVKSVYDTTKYPIIVWLHGEDTGSTPRSQIAGSGISNYASEEYQAKFGVAGGCFIFAPRHKGNANRWASADTVDVRSYIDQFVNANSNNIDSNRIYVMGYSAGADMVWYMLDAYPSYFAAAVIAGALHQPDDTVTAKLRNMPIWLFCSDNDVYYDARTSETSLTFSRLKNATYSLTGLRMTSFSSVVLPDGSRKTENGALTMDSTHCVWYAVTHNMHMINGEPYAYQVTVDGMNDYFDFTDGSGVIDWLASKTHGSAVAYDIPDEVRVPFRLLEYIWKLIQRLFSRMFSRYE